MPEISSLHKTKHQVGGEDEISVASLSGVLANGQTPSAHETSHRSGGADAIAGPLGLAAIPTPLTGKDADTVDGKHASELGGELDIFEKFLYFIPWLSLDGFTYGGDSGYAINVDTAYIYIITGLTTNYDAYIRTRGGWIRLLEAGKKVTIEFIISYLDSITNQNIWLRLAVGAPDPPSETYDHVGWKIVGARLYASTANGTTQTITDTGVDLVADWQWTRLKSIIDPGVSAEFYVNGVLKATHTTNLPTAVDFLLHCHVRTLENAAKEIDLYRILLEKEY